MTHYLEFTAGAISENIPWRIDFDVAVHVEYSNICHHCHSERLEADPPGSRPMQTVTCPRVIVAFNEAGFASTEVCLDCVLEAASAIEARRAETHSGSVHESAVAKPDAHNQSR